MADKVANQKITRHTFSMLETDLKLLNALKKRALQLSIETNKSELMRAGLTLLDQLSDNKFIETLKKQPKTKVGRPNKNQS